MPFEIKQLTDQELEFVSELASKLEVKIKIDDMFDYKTLTFGNIFGKNDLIITEKRFDNYGTKDLSFNVGKFNFSKKYFIRLSVIFGNLQTTWFKLSNGDIITISEKKNKIDEINEEQLALLISFHVVKIQALGKDIYYFVPTDKEQAAIRYLCYRLYEESKKI